MEGIKKRKPEGEGKESSMKGKRLRRGSSAREIRLNATIEGERFEKGGQGSIKVSFDRRRAPKRYRSKKKSERGVTYQSRQSDRKRYSIHL